MPPDRNLRVLAVWLEVTAGEEADALRDTLADATGLIVVEDADDADLHVGLQPGPRNTLRVTAGGPPDEQASTLLADLAPDDMLHAMRLILAGHRIQAVAPSSLEQEHGRPERARPQPLTLTPRETEVLNLLADGASNKVIARRLGISASTTKFHVASVLHKLGARSRLDAVSVGIRLGLVLI